MKICEDCGTRKDVKTVVQYSSTLEKSVPHLCQPCILKRNKENRRLTKARGREHEQLIYQNGEEMVDLPPEKRAILILTCYQKNDCSACNLGRICAEHRGMVAPVPLQLLYRWIDSCCRQHEAYLTKDTCHHQKWCKSIIKKRRTSVRGKAQRGSYCKRRTEDYPK